MPIVIIANDDKVKYYEQDDVILPNRGGVSCSVNLDRNAIDKIEKIICVGRNLDDIKNEIKITIFHYIESLESDDNSVSKTGVFLSAFLGSVIGTAISIYIGQGIKSEWSIIKFKQSSFSWKK